MNTFYFQYKAKSGQLYNSVGIKSESLFFAVRLFYNIYKDDAEIINVRAAILTDAGSFEVIGIQTK